MFQGTVERVPKEPTVLAPSTMNFPVAALHRIVEVAKNVSQEYRDSGFFPFHCPRHVRYVLSVAIAGNV